MGIEQNGGKQISLIARKYFEEVFNTNMLYFEPINIIFDKNKKLWSLEIEVAPFYTNKRKYKLEITEEGVIQNVRQIPITGTMQA